MCITVLKCTETHYGSVGWGAERGAARASEMSLVVNVRVLAARQATWAGLRHLFQFLELGILIIVPHGQGTVGNLIFFKKRLESEPRCATHGAARQRPPGAPQRPSTSFDATRRRRDPKAGPGPSGPRLQRATPSCGILNQFAISIFQSKT